MVQEEGVRLLLDLDQHGCKRQMFQLTTCSCARQKCFRLRAPCMYVYVCMYMHLAECLSVYVSVYLCVCLSVCLCACLPVGLCVHACNYLYVCLPACLSACMHVSMHTSLRHMKTRNSSAHKQPKDPFQAIMCPTVVCPVV